MKLSPVQDAIYRFMLRRQKSSGGPPSCEEIGREFGYPAAVVVQQLRAIRRKGYARKITDDAGHVVHAAIAPYAPDLEACAARLAAAAWKGSTAWRAVGRRVDDGDGLWYDLEDARAVAYWIERGPSRDDDVSE